jgi:hypothetical protein
MIVAEIVAYAVLIGFALAATFLTVLLGFVIIKILKEDF